MKVLGNIFKSPVTSVIGCGSGIPTIVEGIEQHNWTKALLGLGMLLVGLFTREKTSQPTVEK